MNTTNCLPALLLGLVLAVPFANAQQAAAWRFDAVLDSRFAHADGLPVLAVTPGGAAERMGLRAGDRILTINGRPVATAASPARALDDALQSSGGRAEILLLRDGQQMRLQGMLAAKAGTGPQQGCGFVSDTDPTPQVSQAIYAAEVTQVNGRSTALTSDAWLTLPAGTHALVVRELVPTVWLTASQHRARVLMERRLRAKAYKAIVIDVAPDTRYSIGSRLLRDKLDNASIRANAYWEPVVYATRAQPCR